MKIPNVQFEESRQRLKVVMPADRNRFLLILFSVCLLVWAFLTVGMTVTLVRERFGFLLTLMLLIWLFVWVRFGRVLWNRWQYYAATREILFIDEERFIVRRPVSILGLTTAYDMKHVSPFYFSDKHHCPAFDYAYQHVYFGQGLAEPEATQLIRALNGRYFPDFDEP
ncbi:MAG: hypothetical protein ACE5E7_17640 [Anaerolineae bacterium]